MSGLFSIFFTVYLIVLDLYFSEQKNLNMGSLSLSHDD